MTRFLSGNSDPSITTGNARPRRQLSRKGLGLAVSAGLAATFAAGCSASSVPTETVPTSANYFVAETSSGLHGSTTLILSRCIATSPDGSGSGIKIGSSLTFGETSSKASSVTTLGTGYTPMAYEGNPKSPRNDIELTGSTLVSDSGSIVESGQTLDLSSMSQTDVSSEVLNAYTTNIPGDGPTVDGVPCERTLTLNSDVTLRELVLPDGSYQNDGLGSSSYADDIVGVGQYVNIAQNSGTSGLTLTTLNLS